MPLEGFIKNYFNLGVLLEFENSFALSCNYISMLLIFVFAFLFFF